MTFIQSNPKPKTPSNPFRPLNPLTQKNMNWLKILGWFLFIMPLFGLFGFSFWMIMEVMKDDENVKAFILIMIAAWFIGFILLFLSYLTDISILAGI